MSEDNTPDRHSRSPVDLSPLADAGRDLELTAMSGLRPVCENCRHRHSIHVRCSIHATNCARCGDA